MSELEVAKAAADQATLVANARLEAVERVKADAVKAVAARAAEAADIQARADEAAGLQPHTHRPALTDDQADGTYSFCECGRRYQLRRDGSGVSWVNA